MFTAHMVLTDCITGVGVAGINWVRRLNRRDDPQARSAGHTVTGESTLQTPPLAATRYFPHALKLTFSHTPLSILKSLRSTLPQPPGTGRTMLPRTRCTALHFNSSPDNTRDTVWRNAYLPSRWVDTSLAHAARG